MAYLLDGLVILIAVVCVGLGIKRGLIRSAVMLVGFVLAALLAGKLCTPVATAVYDKALESRLQTVLEQKLDEATSENLEFTPGGLFAPDSAAAKYLDVLGLNKTVTINLSEAVSDESINSVMTDVVRPAVLPLLSLLLSFLLFLLLLLAVWLLSILIDKVFKLPVLKQFNAAGGAVVGVLQGVFWSAVFSTLVTLAADGALLGDFLHGETVETTYLVSRLSLTKWIF